MGRRPAESANCRYFSAVMLCNTAGSGRLHQLSAVAAPPVRDRPVLLHLVMQSRDAALPRAPRGPREPQGQRELLSALQPGCSLADVPARPLPGFPSALPLPPVGRAHCAHGAVAARSRPPLKIASLPSLAERGPPVAAIPAPWLLWLRRRRRCRRTGPCSAAAGRGDASAGAAAPSPFSR